MKPVKLRLKIDLVSYPARAEGLVNMIIYFEQGKGSSLAGIVRTCFSFYLFVLVFGFVLVICVLSELSILEIGGQIGDLSDFSIKIFILVAGL